MLQRLPEPHPNRYGLTPEELRPHIIEWKSSMGLVSLEAHYAGRFHPEWKALADELDLQVSAGSDAHAGYNPKSIGYNVQVVDEENMDLTALLKVLDRQG